MITTIFRGKRGNKISQKNFIKRYKNACNADKKYVIIQLDNQLNMAIRGGKILRVFNEKSHNKKKTEIMEKCYDCYAEYGLGNVGIKVLGKACGLASGSLYTYFDDLDDLIIQSTEYCMSKVEDDFMKKAPKHADELDKFIDEIPYWTAKKHGKQYRLMYQVYTNPKYIEHGKKFFDGVDKRYTEYAKLLEPQLGLPHTLIVSFIFILVRASVHYALFEDEYYLKTQLNVLKETIKLFANR